MRKLDRKQVPKILLKENFPFQVVPGRNVDSFAPSPNGSGVLLFLLSILVCPGAPVGFLGRGRQTVILSYNVFISSIAAFISSIMLSPLNHVYL
jgi:hypothetical protein